MAEEVKKSDETTVPIVGLIILALIGYGIYRGIVYILNFREAPPPIVALSAYFADDNGNPVLDEKTPAHLKIKGQVQRPDNQATDGKVRVTVETLDQTFNQTLIIDTKGGNFETEDASLRKLQSTNEIHIKAEFLASASSKEPPGELYLNTRPPKLTSDTLWAIAVGALIVVFIVFFYSFTGKKTPLKNRIAVIFSYCVIGIFLFVPLTAPVLLVPSDRRAMTDRPVALVLTRVGPGEDAKVQWALNIGGYATSPAQPTPTPVATTPTKSPSAGATATAQPSVSPTTSPTAGPTEAASPSPVQTPTRAPQASASPTGGARAPASTPTPTPQVIAASDEDLVVDVQGGLVIPLYVIILSVIGGAINMTRKVPQLQEEGEKSELVVSGIRVGGIGSGLKAALNRIRHPLSAGAASSMSTETTSTEQTSEANKTEATTATLSPAPGGAEAKPPASAPAADDAIAKQIDAKVGELLDQHATSDKEAQAAKTTIRELVQKMKELFDKRPDKKPILDYDSFDDWLKSHPALKDLFTTHWRVELLSQYMYLVSAPFLAIVAYYMLELAGLTKQPIFVLISFSVGLVSERILSWLLGIASGYLRESPSQPATK